MVHVFCLEENCRRVIHLDNHKHWNFEGKIKCQKCGTEMEAKIENGQLISCRKI